MSTKPERKGDGICKVALILSVALHIFFMTGAEAALSLSKRDPSGPIFVFLPSAPSVQMKLPSPLLKSTNETVLPLRQLRVQAPRKVKTSFAMTGKIKQFKTRQTKLDQHLNAVKKEIISQHVRLLQSVGSSVYDADKVPVGIRTSVLPEYLKDMRFQILSEWVLLLGQAKCESCTAIVEYQIDSKGHISNIALLNSSGDQRFDSACLKAVRQSNPLMPLPFHFKQETKEEHLTVSLTFYFEKSKPTISLEP